MPQRLTWLTALICVSICSTAVPCISEEPKFDFDAIRRTTSILENEMELYCSETLEETLKILSKNLELKIVIEGEFRKQGIERDAIDISRKDTVGSILLELLKKCDLSCSVRCDGAILVRNASAKAPRLLVQD